MGWRDQQAPVALRSTPEGATLTTAADRRSAEDTIRDREGLRVAAGRGLIGAAGLFGVIVAASLIGGVPPATAVIVGSDDRRTFEDYAASRGFDVSSLQRRFGASGWLLCFTTKANGDVGVAAATAQLVGRNDIIATASHTFLNTQTGRIDVDLRQCGFIAYANGKVESRKLLPSSLTMPRERATLPSRRFGNDWAVARLDRPIVGVQPYRVVAPEDFGRLQVGAEIKVTTVIGFHDNWSAGGRSTLSINDCAVALAPPPPRSIRFSTTRTRALLTNCDIGRGASGAALLVERGGRPAMLGMTIVSVGADRTSSGQDLDFSANDPHFNIAISVEGGFLDAIRRLTGPSVVAPAGPALTTGLGASTTRSVLPSHLFRGETTN
jgi:hypothetical protein